VIVYTDGACSGNPGPGGWAWAVAPNGEPHGAGGEARTTNQRMELTAVVQALTQVAGDHLVIMSDSTYVVQCFRDRWWQRWQANGWRNAQKKPVANVDLWEPLIELYLERRPELHWVKGHSGDPMNDLVDRLAVAAVPRPPMAG
jgi:ribonuclease HI